VSKKALNDHPENLGLKIKEFNLQIPKFKKIIDTSTKLSSAIQYFHPKQEDIVQCLFFQSQVMGLEHFNLEGEDDLSKTGRNMANGFLEKILIGTTGSVRRDKDKDQKTLVVNEKTQLVKRKLYINTCRKKQGMSAFKLMCFKPMKAMDVDRLGYGDCKALSNYTRALLSGYVPSYTELYGSKDKMDIQSDFFQYRAIM
jgi:hypothetical protein